MDWLIPSVVASLSGTLVLVLVYFYLFVQDRESYLGIWTAAWILYALQFIFRLQMLFNQETVILTIANQTTLLVSTLILLLGAYKLSDRPMPKGWYYLTGFGVLWAASTTLLKAESLSISAPTFLIMAAINIGIGIVFFRMSKLVAFSRRLSGLMFLVWGLYRAGFPFLLPQPWFATWGYLMGVLLELIVAAGILLTYFQKVRYELSESEERLMKFMGSASDAFYLLDPEMHFVEINEPGLAIFGLEREDVINEHAADIVSDIIESGRYDKYLEVLETGTPFFIETTMPQPDTDEISVSLNAFKVGNGVGVILTDITQRKKAEEALLTSESRYRAIVQDQTEFIVRWKPDGTRTFVNESYCRYFNQTAENLTGKNFLNSMLPEDAKLIKRNTRRLTQDNPTVTYECRAILLDGETRWQQWTDRAIFNDDGKIIEIQSAGRDINERKHAQEKLIQSEELYRTHFEQAMEGVFITDSQKNFVDMNVAGCRMLGYTRDEILNFYIHDLIPVDSKINNPLRLERLPAGETVVKQAQLHQKGDTLLDVEISAKMLPSGQLIGIFRDITERLQAEGALRESEGHLRTLIDQAPVGIVSIDMNGDVTGVNPKSLEFLGSTGREATSGMNILAIQALIETGFSENFKAVLEKGEPQETEAWYTSIWGKRSYFRARFVPQYDAHGKQIGVIQIFDDLTEGKQHERSQEAINKLAADLRKAPTRPDMPPVILDYVLDLFDAKGALLAMVDPAGGDIEFELGRGTWVDVTGDRLQLDEGVTSIILDTKQPYTNNDAQDDQNFARPDQLVGITAITGVPLIAQDEVIGVLWMGRDTPIAEYDVRLLTSIAEMTANAIHRATLHEETQRRSRRLVALRNIDAAITTKFDLKSIVEVLFESVLSQLQVDATAFSDYDPITKTLYVSYERGFEGRTYLGTSIRLGDRMAGKVALKRRLVAIPNLKETEEPVQDSDIPSGEGFVAYYGVPLIAKGGLKGVLEVFHRSPLQVDTEWLDFLNTLAVQAAIAKDNSELLDNLELSNIELALAYDNTLEGWARALELRDLETHGHSDRVTDMTLLLSAKMDISSNELVHIRRGALLHDIGKMGVPDRILHKEGPLDDDEWETMQRHPVHAYEMLSPIDYLHPALDIPYYHHEKWDGSGYPTGLKGEEIPLPARIFAVVDVWDALLSDRPYRKAWSKDKALKYIKDQSGKQFDPEVVKLFLDVVQPIK
jgi:PAS domain S-box-containing protein